MRRAANDKMFHRKKPRLPLLNTTSTGDISFMLLVFFLVMTSMDADKGLLRRMPPKDKDKQEEVVNTIERNVLDIRLDAAGKLFIEQKPARVDTLRDCVVKFIAKRADRKKHVIRLNVNKQAQYEAYFHVINAVTEGYNALQDGLARRKFKHSLSNCSTEEKKFLAQYYPWRISETYTTDSVKGGAR